MTKRQGNFWLTVALIVATCFANVQAYAQDKEAVVAVMTGDSIEAGHGLGYKAWFDPGGPGGTIDAELGYQMQRKLGKSWTYKDYAKGGSTWYWIATTPLGMMSAANAQETWIHTGINDIFQRRKWEDVQMEMDTVYNSTTGPLFIDEILPATYINDTMAATVREWNKRYAAWAKDKPRVKIVKCWAAFGRMRASTKHADDLIKKYDCKDLLHLNAAGAEALAAIRVKARTEYFAAQKAAKSSTSPEKETPCPKDKPSS